MDENSELDKDFQKMFLPLNILELVYCQPKFKIASTCVINGFQETIHCILGVVIIIITNVANVYLIDFVHNDTLSETIYKLSLLDAIFYIVSAVFVGVISIVQRRNYLLVVKKMKSAWRVMQEDDGLKRFQKSNWIFVSSIFLSYFIYNLSYTLCNIYRVGHLIYNMILFYFDVNIIVVSRIVKFLEYEVRLWKKELNRFQQTCSETNHTQLIKYLVDVGAEEERLLQAYTDIIRAFKLCSSIFGISILVLMVEAFAHPLIYIQFFIDLCKGAGEANQFVSELVFVVSVLWIIKSFALLSWLCAVSQRFCLAVVDVETTSAKILGEDKCLVPAHRLSKNVLRLGASAGARRSLRAGHLVTVDATTPLQLMMLFGTYTVVLLQFAFL